MDGAFECVEVGGGRSDCRGAGGADGAGVVEGLFGDAAHFVQEFADFDFEMRAAFLDAIDDIGLDARAIHFQQVHEKLAGFALDYREGAHGAEENVREVAQGRRRLGNVKQFFEREAGRNAETFFVIESVRHAREFGDAGVGQFREKIIADADKARGDLAILLLGGGLFGLQPGLHVTLRDGLRGAQGVSAEFRAIAAGQCFQFFCEFAIHLRQGLREELLSLFQEHV